jgi:endonuclease/exonuclease/phosphatase family metal-dependent hydrolase
MRPHKPIARPEDISVVTWNVLHAGLQSPLERTKEAVEHLRGADILLLQEAIYNPDFDAAQEIADRLQMNIVSRGVDLPSDHPNSSSVAILSALPATEVRSVRYTPEDPRSFALAHLVLPSGRTAVVVSAHLAWGGSQEPARLRQALLVDQTVREHLATLKAQGAYDAVAILGADLNALPTSDTVRFLTGLHAVEDQGTYWVDAWASTNVDPGYTVTMDNDWAQWTAARQGITNPRRNPDRRIDYLFVYGWAYGRPGDPQRATLIGQRPLTGVTASDHWGVGAILSDPARKPLTP